jgi:hypothetical protein
MLAIALILLAVAPPQATPDARQDPPAGNPGGARATLDSCLFEDGRWVCRYQMPDIAVVPSGPGALSTATPIAPAGPATPLDPPALTAAEAELMLRCGEASWLSLCTPGQRRTARALRERAEAEAQLRRAVGARLAVGDCAAAERLALEAGRFGLAAQARELCPPPPAS